MERQEGYYWVKKNKGSYFEIAEWLIFGNNNGGFQLCGNDQFYKASDFEYIDEVRIKAPGEMPD